MQQVLGVGTCAVLVSWNRLPDHRSQVVRDNVESLKGFCQDPGDAYVKPTAADLSLTYGTI